MSNIIKPHQKDSQTRPLGVWVLTIYALIFDGVAPLLLADFVLFSGNANGSEISILLSIPLSIGIIISAFGAWKGNETARKSLLLLVTIHYVLIAINNYSLINSGLVPQQDQTQVWARVYRGLVFPAIYFWYFNRRTTKEFYE